MKSAEYFITNTQPIFFVPRPAFEITKSETIRLNSKTMKFKPN